MAIHTLKMMRIVIEIKENIEQDYLITDNGYVIFVDLNKKYAKDEHELKNTIKNIIHKFTHEKNSGS